MRSEWYSTKSRPGFSALPRDSINSRSPITISLAANVLASILAIISGPIPAGSPEVMAMLGRMLHQGGSIKIGYREVAMRRSDGRAPKVGAFRRRQEQLAGSSQIFPEFVQVQTVFSTFHGFGVELFQFICKSRQSLPPSCNMRPRSGHWEKLRKLRP
jgi:hypothetical protein